MGVEEQIKEIEEELSKTKYNKATQKHFAKQRAKLAKLRKEQLSSGSGKGGLAYGVKKRGDATVLFVGFPSAGKSTLLNKLTSAESKIGGYEFTTLDVIPGMMDYKGASIQLLDVPGIIEGAASGKGRGKAVLSVIRNADLILIILDPTKPDQLGIIRNELTTAGIRMDQSPPDIKVIKKDRGGLQVSVPKKLGIEKEVIQTVLNEFDMYNGEIIIRQKVDLDQIVDAMARNLVYVPSLAVVNKADKVGERLPDTFYISALKGEGLETLKEAIWNKLRLMRIYMKRIGKAPDMEEPLIVKKDSTVKDVCARVHKEWVEHFKYARIWGKSAAFEGQQVGLRHKLTDCDVVEIHAE